MSVIQSTQKEIRFIKRKNLDEESRIVGNYYRDLIRLYGIDCIYHKLNLSEFENYKGIVDQNTLLKHAYGYDIVPNYNLSAEMITFAEVDQDIFNLNKYGIVSNTDINLIFDSKQFACDLATKAGIYKEYKIDETEVICEVPACTNEITSVQLNDGSTISGYLSDDIWPYNLGLGYAETYKCGILEGKMRCLLSGYTLNTEHTVICDPYEHTDFKINFPANNDLYRSLKYNIENTDYLETLLFLTFKVTETKDVYGKTKYILHGKTHGSVLFFDIERMGKYAELIHPMVGDIVEIDFPDENNREKYEITDCFDKQLTQDGINPLLHKYVWKCKARRYIETDFDIGIPKNEADKRLDEMYKYESIVQEQAAKQISMYDTLTKDTDVTEDAVYGGYDGVVERYDKQVITPENHREYTFIDNNTCIDVMIFDIGSKLVTDGFDLYFIEADTNNAIKITNLDNVPQLNGAVFESDIKWLNATDNCIVFVNIEGQSNIIAFNDNSDHTVFETNIDSLYESKIDIEKINNNFDNFIKFRGTKTLMWATSKNLYVKFANDLNKKIHIIV